jgi:hypothetical protein
MWFETLSGSVYEVNSEEKKIRRLTGRVSATKRQGQDGEWREYQQAIVRLNQSVMIVWGSANGVLQTTITNIVKKIYEENPNN